MAQQIRWSPRAILNLEEICNHIASDSEYYASLFAKYFLYYGKEPKMKTTKTLQCLLLIPYTEEFGSVRQLLEDYLRESGFEPILLRLWETINSLERAKLLKSRGYIVLPNPDDPIVLDAYKRGAFKKFEMHSRVVTEPIERADFIIADLTGSNPNVMYEIGFAHALRKPILFIVQKGVKHVPSDISGNLYFVYDPSKPEELHHIIRTWISRYLHEGTRAHVNV